MIQLSKPNPYDDGVIIHDGPAGGYRKTLTAWREHITLNLLAGGHTLESLYTEYPQVMEAINRADLLFLHENLDRMIVANPANAAALTELFAHLNGGGSVALAEAFTTQSAPMAMQGGAPQQPMTPPQSQAPQAPPAAQGQQPGADMHMHQVQCGPDGNGQTDAGADGHVHPVRGNQILAQAGHTHDMAQMQSQNQPPAQQPQQPPAQHAAPFAQGA